MKNTNLFLLGLASSTLLAITALSGCGSNSGGTGGAGGTGANSSSAQNSSSQTGSSSGSSMFPAAPVLGAQIDRMGRAAVNTALNHTFDTNAATKGAAKDTYNADKDAAKWAPTYGTEFAKNLGIYDGLDTVCGNQILAGPMPVAGRYDTLGNAMAEDRLWIKTDATECKLYLGVELDATNILKNMDCGGRKLDYDTVDTSYTALSGATMPLTDGVAADADTKGTTFPYLAAPH
jgi:hypothetical protein